MSERAFRPRVVATYEELDEQEFLVSNRAGSSRKRLMEDATADAVHRARQTSDGDGAGGRGRRARTQGKTSPLDAHAVVNMAVTGAPGFTYSLGGAEVGGVEAERVLHEVEVDEGVIAMRGQFADARRMALMLRGRVVAASIIEVQQAPSFSSEPFLEIPILAAERSQRQKGYGSVLYALIAELGILLGMKIVVISSTPESRRFWLRQGFHALTHCEPRVAAALRALAQSGARYGFFETTQMARSLPMCEYAGALVSAALRSVEERQPVSRGLAAVQISSAVGFEAMPPGSAIFVVDAASGRRLAVPHGPRGPPESRGRDQ